MSILKKLLSHFSPRPSGPTPKQIAEIRLQAEKEDAHYEELKHLQSFGKNGKPKQAGQVSSAAKKQRTQFRTDYPPTNLQADSNVVVFDTPNDPTGEGSPDSELIAGDWSDLDLSNLDDDDAPADGIVPDTDADEYGELILEQGLDELEERADWETQEILAHDQEITLQEETAARIENERAEAERLDAIASIAAAVVAHKERKEKEKPARIIVKKGESAPVSFFREMFNFLGLKASSQLPEKVTDLYNDNAKGAGKIVMDRRNQGGKVSIIKNKTTNILGDNNLSAAEALSVVKELYLRKNSNPIDLWVRKGGKAKKFKEFNSRNVHDIAMMQLACEVQGIPVTTSDAIERLKSYKKFDDKGVVTQDNEKIFSETQKAYHGYLEALRNRPNMSQDFEHVRKMDKIITTFPTLQIK